MRWLVVLLLVSSTAFAQSSSPGALATSHAAIQCDACHVNGTPALSNALCAACHDFVQRGLHATTAFQNKTCWGCHPDHRGPRRDIRNWKSIAAFDHGVVWKLDGKHAQTPCGKCHTAIATSGTTRYFGLSTTCGAAGCHQQNPHRFVGPEFLRCDRCHGEATWKPAKRVMDFDHDRDTKLPLVGAHRNTPCVKCHPATQFSLAKFECATCHTPPQHAAPRFATLPCQWCHAPTFTSFAKFDFDHDEKTHFPLAKGHRIACTRCHTGNTKPSMQCESCHPKMDPHGKRFAKIAGGCAACHVGTKWTDVSTFNHGKNTKLALTHKHSTLACRACHRPIGADKFERLQSGCKECHAHATVHADEDHPKGKYTTQQCIQCHAILQHDPPPRPPELVVHGTKSPFPLVKGHNAVPCVDCHTARNAKGKTVFDGVSMECGDSCHEDSAHQGALGKQCTSCHTSGRWDALKFDHQRVWLLEGDHAAAQCSACHGADKTFRGTPRRCVGCHAQDDAHRGALGTTCDRCHLATGENRFSHALSSKFKLEGKHLQVTCDGCHPSIELKPRPSECGGCHPEPRAHFGQYGTWCARCHTAKGWR